MNNCTARLSIPVVYFILINLVLNFQSTRSIASTFKNDAVSGRNPAASMDKLDKFFVQAPEKSASYQRFMYQPSSGRLFTVLVKNGKLSTEPVIGFGSIKDMDRDDIAVLVSDQNYLLVRHGYWISLIDLAKGNRVAAMLGPMKADHLFSKFNKILKLPDGEVVVTFVAKATRVAAEVKHHRPSLLFILRSSDKSINWVEISEHFHPQKLSLRVADGFDLREAGWEKTSNLVLAFEAEYSPLESSSPSNIPREFGKLLLDLHSGDASLTGLRDVLSGGALSGHKTVSVLSGPYEGDSLPSLLKVSDATPAKLLSTAYLDEKDFEKRARDAAVRMTQDKLDAGAALAEKIRIGMAQIRGQVDAIDGLIKTAQRQSTEDKFAVVAVGGPTATGKTTGIRAFLKSLYPEKSNPVYELGFANQTEEKFLQSELFGARQGYQGGETLTGIMMWLLENPDGGGIVFDEIDEAPQTSVKILKDFLDKGEILLTPQLVSTAVASYKDVPFEQWPKALLEGTQHGTKPNSEIRLRLTPNHYVFVLTNAGEETYNGKGQSNVSGASLESEEQIAMGNARFSGETIKKSLSRRGFSDSFLARIESFVPFKPFLKKAHNQIVGERIRESLEKIYKEYVIKVNLSSDAIRFLESETYSPLHGARLIKNQISEWLSANLENLILNERTLHPGQDVLLVLNKDDLIQGPVFEVRLASDLTKTLARFRVGKPLPVPPTELLERARSLLKPALAKEILGNEEAKVRVAEIITTELAEQVTRPDKRGRSIVVGFDGVPGSGKTETVKVIDKVLGDGTGKAVLRIRMNEIATIDDFNELFVKPITAHVRMNPEVAIILLDEFPRAGEGVHRKIIHNKILSIFDEKILPPIDGEASLQKGVVTRSSQPTELPATTIFLWTGNLTVKAVHGYRSGMSNREMQASMRALVRHPEMLKAQYAEEIQNEALRSRMGEPVLYFPLTEDGVNTLRDWKFENHLKVLENYAVSASLSDSAKRYFSNFYQADLGGRWVEDTISKYIKAPLVSLALENREKYKNSQFEVRFDESKNEFIVDVKKGGEILESRLMAKLPRARTEYHPDVLKDDALKTAKHEIGHALVRRVLYPNPGSVSEINAFGGALGGVTYMGTHVASQNLYQDSRKGLYNLAVFLGGHVAEVLFTDGPGDGAISDFRQARDIAQKMILHGSVLDLAPLVMMTDPATGQIISSERNKQILEDRKEELLEISSKMAEHILKRNAHLVNDLSMYLANDPDGHMSGQKFEELIAGKLVVPTEAELEAYRKKNTCEALLKPEVSDSPIRKLSLWKRFTLWLKGFRR